MNSKQLTWGLALEAFCSALILFSVFLPWAQDNFNSFFNAESMNLISILKISHEPLPNIAIISLMLLSGANAILKGCRVRSIVLSIVLIAFIFILWIYIASELGRYFSQISKLFGLGEYLSFAALIGLIVGTCLTGSHKYDCISRVGPWGHLFEMIGTAFLLLGLLLPWGFNAGGAASPLLIGTFSDGSSAVTYLAILTALLGLANMITKLFYNTRVLSVALLAALFIVCFVGHQELTNAVGQMPLRANIGVFMTIAGIILLLTGIIRSGYNEEEEEEEREPALQLTPSATLLMRAGVAFFAVYYVFEALTPAVMSISLFNIIYVLTSLVFLCLTPYLVWRQQKALSPAVLIALWAIAYFVNRTHINAIDYIYSASGQNIDDIKQSFMYCSFVSVLPMVAWGLAVRDKSLRIAMLALITLDIALSIYFYTDKQLLLTIITLVVTALLIGGGLWANSSSEARNSDSVSLFGTSLSSSHVLSAVIIALFLLDIGSIILMQTTERFFFDEEAQVFKIKNSFLLLSTFYSLLLLVLPVVIKPKRARMAVFALVAPIIVWALIQILTQLNSGQ